MRSNTPFRNESTTGRRSPRAVALGVVAALCLALPADAAAQPEIPQHELDPAWPKVPLLGPHAHGRARRDVRGRPRPRLRPQPQNVVPEDLDGATLAPPIVEFDPDGNVVGAWGDPEALGGRLHDCHADADGNLWIIAAGTGVVQKYSRDGELLLRIGEAGRYDSSDGTRTGEPLNSDRAQFFLPAAIDIDAETGEIYVADGELPGGNQRIAVLSRDGEFLRQWPLHRTDEERDVTPVPHCLRVSGDGLVYVCDREADRIQVFDREGTFIGNIDVPWEPLTPSEGRPSGTRGTAVVVAFSPDPEQRWLYVVNQNRVMVDVLDRRTGEVVSSFGGGPGRYRGQFTLPHGIGVDPTDTSTSPSRRAGASRSSAASGPEGGRQAPGAARRVNRPGASCPGCSPSRRSAWPATRRVRKRRPCSFRRSIALSPRIALPPRSPLREDAQVYGKDSGPVPATGPGSSTNCPTVGVAPDEPTSRRGTAS